MKKIHEILKDARLAGCLTMDQEAAIVVAVEYLANARLVETEARKEARVMSAMPWAIEAAKKLCADA